MVNQSKFAGMWRKNKWLVAGLSVLLVLAGGVFYLASGKVRQAAEQSLLKSANEWVNGKIMVGGIDLSILGTVDIKQLQVLDQSGQLLAHCDRVRVRYDWSDLFKGRLGLEMVTGIWVDKPEVWLAYQAGQLNVARIFHDRGDAISDFSKIVKIRNGTIHLETPLFTKKVEQLQGTIEGRGRGVLVIAATGKVDQTEVKLGGQWGNSTATSISVTANGLDLVKLGLTKQDDPIQLTSGTLDEVIVHFGKDQSGVLTMRNMNGRLAGVATLGEVVITHGSAGFSKEGDTFVFSDIQALYRQQAINGTGRVVNLTENEKQLDFVVRMPNGDPKAVLPGLETGGRVIAAATITGLALSPVVAGEFSLGSLQFGDLAISNINGAFAYKGKVLQLLHSRGMAADGTISANGVIDPEKASYHLAISGNGITSTKLTKKDVSGPLSFNGTAVADATGTVSKGTFSVYNGQTYGITFRTLSGNFIKQGTAETEVSNLVLQTDYGTFYPEQINQDIMARLKERNLPTTKEALKKAGTELLLQQLLR